MSAVPGAPSGPARARLASSCSGEKAGLSDVESLMIG